MKKKYLKPIIIVILSICVCYLAVISYNQLNPTLFNQGTEKKILVNNINELEISSDLLVVCKALKGSKENIIYDEDKTPIHGYTISPVEVIKVLKGNKDVVGNTIIVYEPTYVYKIPAINKQYIMTIDGYQKLSQNNNYLLYLTKVPDADYYTCTSVSNGKYVLNNKTNNCKTVDALDGDDMQIYEVTEEYISIFNDIKVKHNQLFSEFAKDE